MERTDFYGELIFFSAIAGGFAAPLKTIFHRFLTIPGLFSTYYDQFTFYLIHGHSPMKGVWSWVFGEIGDIVLGAFLGIILGLWLKFSRPKFHWWIGLTFGLGVWFITLALGNVLQIIKPGTISPPALLGHLLSMLIYGVNFVLAACYWKPLKKRIKINPFST